MHNTVMLHLRITAPTPAFLQRRQGSEMRAKLEPASRRETSGGEARSLCGRYHIVYRASPRLHLDCSLPFPLLRSFCCVRLSFKSTTVTLLASCWSQSDRGSTTSRPCCDAPDLPVTI